MHVVGATPSSTNVRTVVIIVRSVHPQEDPSRVRLRFSAGELASRGLLDPVWGEAHIWRVAIAHHETSFPPSMTVARRSPFLRAVALSIAITSLGQAQSFGDAPIRTVALNGIQMSYRDLGAGDPLVLLHGFGSCSEESWAPFADSLAQRYRLIIPDLRGHGRSTNPTDAFTHKQSAADVLALLDSLGVARFKAVGISTGGMTLLHAALRAPARIERLVVVSVGTSMPDETRAWVRETTLSTLPPEVAAGFRGCAARGESQAASLAAQFGRFADAPGPDVFAPLDVSAVTAPVLLVQGDRDIFFPLEQTLALYRSLRDAQMWVIPGGEHVPIYAANVPFVAVTLAFLSAQ